MKVKIDYEPSDYSFIIFLLIVLFIFLMDWK